MSTAWYFHTFESVLFQKLCGSATPKQAKQFVQALTDPDEFGDIEEEDLKRRSELATALLTEGFDYSGKSPQESEELDEIAKMLFHRMGTAKAINAKPVSPEAISCRLAGELTRVAKDKRPTSILTCFDNGRRFGQTTSSRCGYMILNRVEIKQLREDVLALRADTSVAWKLSDVQAIVKSSLIPPLDKALADEKLWLYGTFT